MFACISCIVTLWKKIHHNRRHYHFKCNIFLFCLYLCYCLLSFFIVFFFCYQDLIILFTSALYLILAKMLNMLKAEFKYSFSFSVLELIWPGKMHVQKILKRIRMSMTTRKRNKCVTYDFRFCKEVSWS